MEDEFLQLSHCELVHLIQRDELNVPDEKDVYNAVLKWVRHDEETRQPKMEQILQAVRYGFISHYGVKLICLLLLIVSLFLVPSVLFTNVRAFYSLLG